VRVATWDSELIAYVSSPHAFKWGKNDCALMGANWVRECTGVDIAAAFRGHYTTSRGAVRALKTHGTGGLVATMDGLLPSAPLIEGAHRGDLVGLPSPDRLFDCVVGIAVGDVAAVLGTNGKIAYLPISQIIRIWRVT